MIIEEILYVKANKGSKIETFAKEIVKLRKTVKKDIMIEIKNTYVLVSKDMSKKDIIRTYLDKKYGAD